MQEPRWKQSMGIGYIVSPTGADHCHNMPDNLFTAVSSPQFKEFNALGLVEGPLPVDDLSPAKIRLFIHYTAWQHFLNCAGCCYFVVMYGLVPLRMMVDLVRSVTGWDINIVEMFKIGERAVNLAQVFNLREGLTPEGDYLPRRFFTPLTAGPLQGVALDETAVQKAKETYYDMMGWPKGWPSLGKLEELAIDWAVPLLKEKKDT
jgi:aldehyde:ferredoxin oxidoreductase